MLILEPGAADLTCQPPPRPLVKQINSKHHLLEEHTYRWPGGGIEPRGLSYVPAALGFKHIPKI